MFLAKISTYYSCQQICGNILIKNDGDINLVFKKGVGITIRSTETSGKLAIYLQPTLATICVCSYKQNSSWVASYIHACTNETHSIANLQDLIPTLVAILIGNTN